MITQPRRSIARTHCKKQNQTIQRGIRNNDEQSNRALKPARVNMQKHHFNHILSIMIVPVACVVL